MLSLWAPTAVVLDSNATRSYCTAAGGIIDSALSCEQEGSTSCPRTHPRSNASAASARCASPGAARSPVENGRFVALEPDPSHPTGKALCAKGRAAPELVYHPDRLLYPLQAHPAKGRSGPGWQRISWEEALDPTAERLRALAREHGPEAVVFSVASRRRRRRSSTRSTGSSGCAARSAARTLRVDGAVRLGPLHSQRVHLGAAVPGVYMPDLETGRLHPVLGLQPSASPGSPMRPRPSRRSSAARG